MRQKWEEALERKKEFYEECVKDEDKGPQYFASNAGPKIESVRAALSEYEQLKREVQNDQAVIYEYTCGDIGIVIENAFVCKSTCFFAAKKKSIIFTAMKEHQRNECGSGGSGAEYYETTLDPSDWYTWFKGEDAVDENGWTSVSYLYVTVYIQGFLTGGGGGGVGGNATKLPNPTDLVQCTS